MITTVVSEIFYCVIGLWFILSGVKALRDTTMGKIRFASALFWFVLAFTFILGPYFPAWITGVLIIVVAVISAFKGIRPSASKVPTPEETRAHADKVGYKIFIPALSLGVVAFPVITFLPFGTAGSIGIAGIVALIIGLILAKGVTKSPHKTVVEDGTRLLDRVGPTGILPQILAALGALFTAAGVGDVIGSGISTIVPEGNRFIAVVVYCVGMAVFTIIMGNGFAAFSVITVGIGFPFLILQGADPVVVGALGLTAGYCGTLVTPMAANFNVMPAALLETKDKYAMIKAQAPVAVVLLIIHILLMYFLAF